MTILPPRLWGCFVFESVGGYSTQQVNSRATPAPEVQTFASLVPPRAPKGRRAADDCWWRTIHGRLVVQHGMGAYTYDKGGQRP